MRFSYRPAVVVTYTHFAYAYVATIVDHGNLVDEDVWAAIGEDVVTHFAYAGDEDEANGTITYRGTIVVSDDGDQGWHRDILANLVAVAGDEATLTLTRVPGFMA